MLKPDNNNRGSTTPASSKHRVEPNFFGSPHLYNHPSRKDNSEQPPNPNWDQPPPAYSSAPNELCLPSTISVDPSAPPLEPDENTGGYSQQNDSRRSQQQQQAYPPQGYHQYGSIPQRPYNTTSDANIPSWPWISPPSATGQPILPNRLQRPTEGEYQNHSAAEAPTKKRSKHCCEASIRYLFYFFCICLVIRLISGGLPCTDSVVWNLLPKTIEFDSGFTLRIIGGHLTSGYIAIKSMDEKDNSKVGLIQATASISPTSLAHNTDLNLSISYIRNSTILEIFIPQDLSSKSHISLNAVIHVPAKTEFISVDTQNSLIEVLDERLQVDDLRLKTTNQAIRFNSAWQGRMLILENKNARIELNQPIVSSQSVHLSTTNGGVRVHGNVDAAEMINIYTTNAAIDINSTLSSRDFVGLYTSNSHINLHNVSARSCESRTSNGHIQVDYSYVKEIFNLQTTNGLLKMNMEQGRHAKVVLRSTNSEVTSNLPADFEGTFELDTGSHNTPSITDLLDWIHIQTIRKGHMSGTRFPPGDANYTVPVGHLRVVTTNANAFVTFPKSAKTLF